MISRSADRRADLLDGAAGILSLRGISFPYGARVRSRFPVSNSENGKGGARIPERGDRVFVREKSGGHVPRKKPQRNGPQPSGFFQAIEAEALALVEEAAGTGGDGGDGAEARTSGDEEHDENLVLDGLHGRAAR